MRPAQRLRAGRATHDPPRRRGRCPSGVLQRAVTILRGRESARKARPQSAADSPSPGRHSSRPCGCARAPVGPAASALPRARLDHAVTPAVHRHDAPVAMVLTTTAAHPQPAPLALDAAVRGRASQLAISDASHAGRRHRAGPGFRGRHDCACGLGQLAARRPSGPWSLATPPSPSPIHDGGQSTQSCASICALLRSCGLARPARHRRLPGPADRARVFASALHDFAFYLRERPRTNAHRTAERPPRGSARCHSSLLQSHSASSLFGEKRVSVWRRSSQRQQAAAQRPGAEGAA